jgi:AcrR family transcriptional regulator
MTRLVILAGMARSRPPERLDAVAGSAIALFSERGFRRTQMADVARRVGLSPGALYGYVEGKDALFDLAVRRAFGDEERPGPLPLPTPAPDALRDRVRGLLRRRLHAPLLAERAPARAPSDPGAELAALLDELYGGLERNATGIRLIERCAPDRPELAELYFGRGRAGLIERWRRYLERRIAEGCFRPVPDAAIAARLVIETVAWFAWHRRGDPAPQPMSDALARETVIALLSRALLSGGPT